MSERLQRAVALTMRAGYQLETEAFDFLKAFAQTGDPVRLVEEALNKIGDLSERPLFIDRGFLEETAGRVFPTAEEPRPPPITEARRVFRAYAKDVEADVRVMEDPTEELGGSGSVEEYLGYFRDRFERVRRILRERVDVREAVPLSEALRAPVNSRVKVVGMVTEKRESKGRILLRLEDMEDEASVLVTPGSSREVLERARTLLLDQVICVAVVKGRNDLLIAEELIWPDVPQRKPQKAPEPVFAALISDLHVGSKAFMGEAFQRFIHWLRGEFGDAGLRRTAGHVKYVVIAGDLVDGIGVYPNQVEELATTDVYEQYREVAGLLEQIPDYIEVIFIPGNHDASRNALPQPAIPRGYAEPLHEARKVRSHGNPCTIGLHGVELLLYHGRSLDDVVASIPNVSFQTPGRAMRLLLQSRHLAPVYGSRTPIAPEKRDFLVIERPPDIFHAGHVHVLQYETYRGTLLVNSGAWQRQTEYQRKMGLTPNPGIVPIINLQTLEITPVAFTSG